MLCHAYYYATRTARQWYLRHLAAQGRAPIAVLAYHRIADDDATPWTTSTASFVRSVGWLRRHFELISLDEVQRRVGTGVSPRPAVSLTFDDGYADNCRHALPLLIENRIPCTYFVTTSAVLQGAPFDHDLRCGRRLAPNTLQDIREMAGGGIEIGAHTRTHPDLGQVSDPCQLHDELVAARDELEQALGTAVRFFAFPFGKPANLSAAAMQLARQAGYAGVCSVYGRWNRPGDDPFHIRRKNVDGASSRAQHWALPDPLRQRLLPDFPCSPAAACPSPGVVPHDVSL